MITIKNILILTGCFLAGALFAWFLPAIFNIFTMIILGIMLIVGASYLLKYWFKHIRK